MSSHIATWFRARWWIWRHPIKAAAIRRFLADQQAPLPGHAIGDDR